MTRMENLAHFILFTIVLDILLGHINLDNFPNILFNWPDVQQ